MSQKRAFILANLALVVASGGFAYYLATAKYSKPKEIADAEIALEEIEDITTNPPTPEAQQTPVGDGSLPFMRPLMTLTPQPTETPRPSPTPVPLKLVIQTWTLTSLDETVVDITDSKNGDSFTINLGQAHQVTLPEAGISVAVTLCKVDLENGTATFCANGQEETKTF